MAETLLSIVQQILSDMDGDEVNSISETEESEQVAKIVVSVYRNLVSNSNWDHTRRALTLVARSDTNFPTHMKLGDDVKELTFINYDKRKNGETKKNYQEVKWKEPDDFLRYINLRDNTQSNTDVIVDDSGIDLLILNDKAPDYYTTFDDTNLIFDSYDSEVDTTLQESKVQAQGYVMPTLALTDDAVPELPPDAMAMFIETATSRAQYKVRQFEDVMSERESAKQRRWLSRKQWRTNGGIRYPDWGKGPSRHRDVTFKRNR